MIRGCRTFMTTNQPTTINDQRRQQRARHEQQRDDHRRSPRDERPEERDRHEQAGGDRGQRDQRQAHDDAGDEGDHEVGRAQQCLPAQEPAERARDGRLEQAGLLGVGRRHEPEEEGQDLVAVDDHVDRQEEDDQHRPDHAHAGDRDLLQRRDQDRGHLVEVVEDRRELGQEVDLAEADRVQPGLPRRDDRREVALDLRDRGDELGDRRRECAGDHHDDRRPGSRPRRCRR